MSRPEANPADIVKKTDCSPGEIRRALQAVGHKVERHWTFRDEDGYPIYFPMRVYSFDFREAGKMESFTDRAFVEIGRAVVKQKLRGSEQASTPQESLQVNVPSL